MSDSLEKNMIGSIHLGDLEIDIFKYCNADRPFMIKMIQNLKPEYFESMLNAKIFRCYKECFDKYNKTPTEKILNLMLQNMGEQQNMIDMITRKIYSAAIQVDNAEREYITKEVVTFAKRARMIDAIGQSLELIDKNDFEKIVQITKEALLFNLDIQSGYDLYDVDTRYRNLLESTMNVIPTGYSQIDSVLYGGWRKKELYCVMGPPGFGKCQYFDNFIDIEIDDEDPEFEKIKHLLI